MRHENCPGCRYGTCRVVTTTTEALELVQQALGKGDDVGVFRVSGGALQVHTYPRGKL